jgi:hypothetical protein
MLKKLRTSPPFVEPEGLIPRSQEPAAGLYPQPGKFSPHHLTLFLKDLF